MVSVISQVLLMVHLLSAAAWFGALVYRAFFVDPKALQFFQKGADYEQFSVHLADGMRGVVLAALLVCGLSGFALLGLHGHEPSTAWWWLMAVKGLVWMAAFAVFTYISWVFWPRRVFAVEAEYAQVSRQGRLLALVMIAFAGLGLVLGQLGQTLRNPGAQNAVTMITGILEGPGSR